MQIVIDIPNEDISNKQEIIDISLHFIEGEVCECTYPYIVFPKGHGRLIDADTLEECKEVMNTIMNVCEYAVRMDEVRNVPTIIEADKAERGDKG